MSDQENKQNKGELIDIKSLIGDADGGDFTLDDILAEYGHPVSDKVPDNVVAFPGRRTAPPPEEADSAEEPFLEEEPFPEDEPPEEDIPEEVSRITPFPKKRNRLSALVHDLNQRADHYADHMFEEDESIDKEEVRRLERLIPGTDQEEIDDEPPLPAAAQASGTSAP